jgi:hypothetical protein
VCLGRRRFLRGGLRCPLPFRRRDSTIVGISRRKTCIHRDTKDDANVTANIIANEAIHLTEPPPPPLGPHRIPYLYRSPIYFHMVAYFHLISIAFRGEYISRVIG